MSCYPIVAGHVATPCRHAPADVFFFIISTKRTSWLPRGRTNAGGVYYIAVFDLIGTTIITPLLFYVSFKIKGFLYF